MKDDLAKRSIELCLAVYRVTDKFPRDEVLRHRLRGLAIDIVEFLVYKTLHPTTDVSNGRFFNSENFRHKLKLLFAYFNIAEKQTWVDSGNFRTLRGVYIGLYENFLESNLQITQTISRLEKPQVSKSTRRVKAGRNNFSDRQEKIITVINKSIEGATMESLAVSLGISKKTVERDLKPLLMAGTVYKKGQTRGAKFLKGI